MVLTYAEEIELRYLFLKGFTYLVRNEIGSVNVFVNKPHRDKETNYIPHGKTRGGYDYWIETKTPISIEEQRRCRAVELGEYKFVTWKSEPILISDLLSVDKEKEVYVLLSDGDGTMRSKDTPFGVAVKTEDEAKRFVSEGNCGYTQSYEKLTVFDDKDEAIHFAFNKER